jgi:cytochrome c
LITSLFACILTAGVVFQGSSIASATDEATPIPLPLPAPRFSEPPQAAKGATLAEQGTTIYFSLCLPCHGDKGQGLTDEWRAQFGQDQKCTDCHPSEGVATRYAFPRAVPALVGTNTLLRFITAKELKEYIQQKMPWWDLGFMNEIQAWQLAAFLLPHPAKRGSRHSHPQRRRWIHCS